MAAPIFSDERIRELIAVSKGPLDESVFTPAKRKGAHLESSAEIVGDDGSIFTVRVRRAVEDARNFSIILSWRVPGSTREFRLLRCNGSNHRHENKIEGDEFRGACHEHRATARYQERGFREDGYAMKADYADFRGAVARFKAAAGIVSGDLGPLFDL